MQIGLHYSRRTKIKGLDYLTSFEFLIITSLLLICSGDIEPNPGPTVVQDNASTHSTDNTQECIVMNNFSVVHYNIQSILNKVDVLGAELKNFDIICLTETWLNPNISDDCLTIDGFKLYRRDRRSDSHGGICVYAKNNVYCRRRSDLELPDIECVWLELNSHHRKFLIGTFYRPPNSSAEILSLIEDSIGLAFDTNVNNIFITGDFNLDILKNSSRQKVRDICQHFSVEQLITEPTHYTESSSSIIDLVFTSNKTNILSSGVGDPFLEQNIRYHCPVFFVLNFNKNTSPIFHRHIWLFDRGDYDSFSQSIQETNWSMLKNDDINIYAKNVTEKISTLATQHIPNKTIKVRKSDPPWLTNEIKIMIRKRKRLYNKYKITKNIIDFENYKHLRNKVITEVRKSKQLQTDKLAEKLKNKDIGQRDWWRVLKGFIKPEQASTPPPLVKDDIVHSDETEKANILNDFFAEQTVLNEINASLPADSPQPPYGLDSLSTTPQEVEMILKSLKLGKAAGPDSINNRILKELAFPLSFPLCDLFNFSLSSGKVPSIWKEANVTPIFKKDDPSIISNYRPISLLSTIGKVLEKIVHKNLFNFIRDHEILTTLQSGFIPGDSTVNQLVDIYNTFCKALDEGKEVRAIFCDVSKAFDRVWHKGLLYKLQTIGISGPLLAWFKDYLDNRRQRVVLPGAVSGWTSLKAGVPQGSILGPLLFLVYINDIVEDIHSAIRLFADDTSLYIIVEDPLRAADQLNSDLAKIHLWANKWLVSFNPSKSESIIFSRKQIKPFHPPVKMNQQQISEVNSHKHLGLIFSNDCTWHEHLDYIKTKAWHRVNIMRKLKFTLDRKSLQTIYISFIRPLLEYADVVWDNCTQYEANELEQIQNEAARIVTGATKLVSIQSLLSETGWESLTSRREKHKLILYYKMQNGLTPDFLSSLVPPTVGSTTTYNLRNFSNLQTVHASSQLYYKSFLPSVTRSWNELSEDKRNSTSVAVFKSKLQCNVRSPPSFFFDGKRTGQIHHARLRLNCSSLSQHLFSKNIVESPLCECGAVEDTKHFLLECHRYRNLRVELNNTISLICPPTLNILLHGSSELTDSDNKKIFLAVHDFIVKSKRF